MRKSKLSIFSSFAIKFTEGTDHLNSAIFDLASAGAASAKEQSSKITMVAGQVVAYCIQECDFDPKTNTFTLPSDEEPVSENE